jgi:hypothetical protein
MSNALTIIMGGEGNSNKKQGQNLLPAPAHPVHVPVYNKPVVYTGAGYAAEFKGTSTNMHSVYNRTDIYGTTTSTYSGGSNIIKKLSETTALLVTNYPSASGTKSIASILTFDQNNPSVITRGATTTLFSGYTVQMGTAETSRHKDRHVMVGVTPNKGIIWGYDSVNARIIAQAFTISGTTVTVGTPTFVNGGVLTGVDESACDIADISGGGAFKYIVYNRTASGGTATQLMCFSVSGTTITTGASIGGVNNVANGGIAMCALNNDKALLATMTGTGIIGLTVVTVSGTTPTVNTTVNLPVSLSTFSNNINLMQLNTDKAVLFHGSSTVCYASSISVSGTVPSGTVFGSSFTPTGTASAICVNPTPLQVGTNRYYFVQCANAATTKGCSIITWKIDSSSTVVAGSKIDAIAQNSSTSTNTTYANMWTYSYNSTSGNIVWYLLGESGTPYMISSTFDPITGALANILGTGLNLQFSYQNAMDGAYPTSDAIFKFGTVQISDSLTITVYYSSSQSRPMMAFHNHGAYSRDMILGRTGGGILAGLYTNGYILCKGTYTFSSDPVLKTGSVYYADATTGDFTTTVGSNVKIGRYMGNNTMSIKETIL